MSILKELKSLPTDTKTLRKFGLMVGGVFLAIATFLLWRKVEWGIYLAYVGAPLFLVGAVFPRALKQVYLGWMAMALAIGTVMTAVLLTLFFILVITPVGLFFKLIGRDVLQRKFDREAPSYWITKEYPITDRKRYENFF